MRSATLGLGVTVANSLPQRYASAVKTHGHHRYNRVQAQRFVLGRLPSGTRTRAQQWSDCVCWLSIGGMQARATSASQQGVSIVRGGGSAASPQSSS